MVENVGEVGAVFFLDDKASGALNRIGQAFDRVQSSLDQAAASADLFSKIRFTGIQQSLSDLQTKTDGVLASFDALSRHNFIAAEKSVTGLADTMMDLGVAAGLTETAFTSAMSRIVTETGLATTEIRRFEAAAHAASAAAANMRVPPVPPGGPPRRGGGGGGGGGGHGISSSNIAHYGGMSAFLYSPWAMAGGLVGYEALSEGAKYDLAIRNTIMSLGATPGTPEGDALRPVIEGTVSKASVGTIFSKREVAETGVGFASIFGSAIPRDDPDQMLSPMEKAKRISGIEGTVMRFAETEKQMGHGSLEQNAEAGVFLAHLTRQYTPEGLGGSLDRMLSISRMTGQSPLEIERVMKYSVTSGGLAGVDPSDLMTATGFLTQSGITGSTAGTGLAQLIQGIVTGAAPSAGGGHKMSQDQTRANLERALHGTVGTGRRAGESKSSHDQKLEGLHEMGILDAGGKPMPGMTNKDGDLQLWPVIEALSKFAETPGRSKLELAAIESKVFNVRGARAGEPFMGKEQLQLLSQYRQQEDQFRKTLGVDATQKAQAESPMQELQQVWARTKDLMIDTVMPGLTDLGKAAKALADALATADAYMKEHSLLGKVVMDAVGGALVGGAAGSVIPGVGTVGGMIIGGAAGALWPLANSAANTPIGSGGELHPFGGVNSMSIHPPTPRGSPVTDPRSSGSGASSDVEKHSSNGVSVHVGQVNFSPGTPRDHVTEFMQILAEELSHSSLHDLGSGQGSLSSGYTTGRTLSV